MRIGTSLSGMDLTALNNLYSAQSKLIQSSQRLSTMHRINSGKDDPAGLIAVEQMLSELTSIRAANDSASPGRGHDPRGRFGHVASLRPLELDSRQRDGRGRRKPQRGRNQGQADRDRRRPGGR